MERKMEIIFAPLGMVGVFAYLAHTTLGRILWKEYNPISMDISTLTANGAPHADLLKIFTTLYGICMVLFALGMFIKAIKAYNRTVQIGYGLLIFMEVVSFVGYGLFPLDGDKSVMTFQNAMHIAVTGVVVFTSIAFGFVLAIGYIRQSSTKKLGKFVLIMAILITLMGLTNPIGMGNGWHILGLTERLVIYTVLTLIFVLSYIHTFDKRLQRKGSKSK